MVYGITKGVLIVVCGPTQNRVSLEEAAQDRRVKAGTHLNHSVHSTRVFGALWAPGEVECAGLVVGDGAERGAVGVVVTGGALFGAGLVGGAGGRRSIRRSSVGTRSQALDEDRPIAEVAWALGVVPVTFGNWVGQERIERGERAGSKVEDRAEPAELRTERDLLKRSTAVWVTESTG